MRWISWVLLLLYSAQLLPAQTAGRPRPETVCFIISKQPKGLPKRVAMQLEQALQRSGKFRAVAWIEYQRAGKLTKPLPKQILKRALTHDIVICFGTLPTRIALMKKKMPKNVRIYTVCSLGIAHINSKTKIFPGLNRLRGGVALDVPLATAIDFSERLFVKPGPYGTIVTPTVPKEIIAQGIEHAKQLGVKLHVAVATGATLEEKARELNKLGIRTFIKLPDPLGVHSHYDSMKSAMANVEIMFKRKKIAVMGIGPHDVSAAYCFIPSPDIVARTMYEMLEADHMAPTRPRPGIVCTSEFQPNLLDRLRHTHLKARAPTPNQPNQK